MHVGEFIVYLQCYRNARHLRDEEPAGNIS